MGVEAMVAQCLERDPMGVRDSGGAMFGEGSPAPPPMGGKVRCVA